MTFFLQFSTERSSKLRFASHAETRPPHSGRDSRPGPESQALPLVTEKQAIFHFTFHTLAANLIVLDAGGSAEAPIS
jgi:hypothetical protein